MPRAAPDPDARAAPHPPSPPNAGRYLHGAAWSALNAVAGALLPLGIFVVFARWLPAAEIGAVALGVAASEMIKAFGLPGLYEALLQQRDDRQPDNRRRCAETALACLLLGGAALFGLHLLLASLLVRLVPGVEQAWLVIAVTGLRIPLDLAALQPQAALAERLAFRRLALRSVVATAGAGAIGLGLVFAGQALAGLVAYQVGLSALLLLLTAAGGGTLARPRLHRDCLRRMWPEAWRASAIRLVAAVNNYLDQVVVAGLLGGLRLAYYNLAKRIETILISAAASFSAILFQPVFARRPTGDNPAGNAQGLQRGLMVLTATCGLATAVIVVTHPRLIPLVFGPAWAEAAPIAACLAFGGFARALGSAHGALLSVSGRNRQLLWVSLGSAGSGLALVALLAPVGLVPCAAALALRSVASTGAMAWLTRRDLPGMGRAYALAVGLPFGLMLAAASGGSLLADRLLAGMPPGPWTGLLALATAGTAAAGGVLLYFGLGLLLRRRRARPAA
ncbi:oligosaccharide flippase family protein [Dankookia sp. GCM10030260]|uniref:oligosaccharide flippase family protein n=1 Tax=Dankookia sp. GCM10030260 TaxID=3273390 RepID=UPI003619BB5C